MFAFSIALIGIGHVLYASFKKDLEVMLLGNAPFVAQMLMAATGNEALASSMPIARTAILAATAEDLAVGGAIMSIRYEDQ